jgi:S1-C subfamily serine protease
MTEESRAPHETPPHDDESARDPLVSPSGPPGYGPVAAGDVDQAGDSGFAPPDRPGYAAPAPPSAPASPRPAFTPPSPTRPLGAPPGATGWPGGQQGQQGQQASGFSGSAYPSGSGAQGGYGPAAMGHGPSGSAPGSPGGVAGPGTAGYGGAGAAHGPGGPHDPGGHGAQPSWASTPLPATGTARGGGPSTGVLLVIGLIIALVAGGAGAVIGSWMSDGSGSSTVGGVSIGEQPGGSANRRPGSIADVASKAKTGVVMIKVADGAGSGFIVENGYIITNNHVVEQAENGGPLQVIFHDQKVADAKVIGSDPNTDVAVIKPEGVNGMTALPLGNSDAIQVGDPVIAIGSPLGLSGTVTTGIVSAKNRPLQAGGENGGEAAVFNAIQTDAAINPGNSGGPLVDEKGRVVGINSVIKTLGTGQLGEQVQGGNIGLGFAIPINQAKRVAEQLIKTGRAEKPIIGATMNMQFQGPGAQIASGPDGGRPPLLPDGPAEKAGLRPGDVIVKFNGKPIGKPDELIAEIRSRTPGDKVSITFQRGSEQKTVSLTLAAG